MLTQSSLYVPITSDVKKSSVCLTNLASQTMLHAKVDGKEIKGIINKRSTKPISQIQVIVTGWDRVIKFVASLLRVL